MTPDHDAALAAAPTTAPTARPARRLRTTLAVTLAVALGSVLGAQVTDPAPPGRGTVPTGETWVHDGTAFPRLSRVDLAAGSWPHVVGVRDPFLHPFDSRDAFNVPLSVAAVHADPADPGAGYWADVDRGVVNHRNGWSVEVVRATVDDPVRRFTNPDLPADHPDHAIELRVPDGFEPPAGSGGKADGATVLVQPDGDLVDLYRPERQPDGDWTASRWERHDSRGSGLLTGVRAAGVSYAAGLIRAWELEAVGVGTLDRFEHRLALSLPPRTMDPAPDPSDGYVTYDGSGEGRRPVGVWPANTQDTQSTTVLRYRGDVPMGTTVALRADVDVELLGEDLGVADDPYAMATLRTLQSFGGVVTDASTSNALYVEPSADPDHVDGVQRAWARAVRHVLPVRGITPLQPAGGPAPYRWHLAPDVAR